MTSPPHPTPRGSAPRSWSAQVSRALPYVLLVAVSAWLWWPSHSGPPTGGAAADFDLPVVSGRGPRFHLADQRGGPVLIEVFASWCGVCRTSAPTLVEVAGAPRATPVRFLAVSVDDEAGTAAAAARDWGLTMDVLHADPGFARDYGITVLPTFILVDASGTVREVATGALGQGRLESWLTSVGAARR